jgi:glutathione S-transferase
MSEAPFTLYGISGSLYTGKVRAYLRHHGIAFEERALGHPDFGEKVLPQIGRLIIPVVTTAEGELLQDGTDILDYFEERKLGRHAILPEDAVLRSISYLFELFGGEGLLRPAMHYRWNFNEDNLPFIRSFFAEAMPAGLNEKQANDMFDFNSSRMRNAARVFGVVPETMAQIEESYKDFLTRFDAHLSDFGFLLGNQATLGDYGLFNPLYAHLGRDPHPAKLMKTLAPGVFMWTERMNGPETYQDHKRSQAADGLISAEAVPETLKSLMRYVSDEYLAELQAHVAYANEWLAERPDIAPGTNGLKDPAQRGIGMAEFNWRGHEIKTSVMPYRFYLLQRLTDCFSQAGDADQKAICELFAETGLETILELRTTRRVERANHLEVWGDAA